MIIDAHCHLGYSPQFHFPDTTVKTLLRVMDGLQIDRAVCCHLALLAGEVEFGLRESLEAYRESGGRLPLYTAFDPRAPGGIEFVTRCLDQEGFVGIKIHPSFHQCWADDERYRAVWELAAEKQVPMLTHSWDVSEQNPVQKYSFPSRFEKYAAEYPEATVILGHAGGRYHGHIAAANLAVKYRNVLLDTAGDCYTAGLIEYLVGRVGADRILFGSDITWIDPRTQLGMILDADISTADKQKILRLNATRVFPYNIHEAKA
jgi:predicted TIM-barrel fold metal-dependent hydrolase